MITRNGQLVEVVQTMGLKDVPGFEITYTTTVHCLKLIGFNLSLSFYDEGLEAKRATAHGYIAGAFDIGRKYIRAALLIALGIEIMDTAALLPILPMPALLVAIETESRDMANLIGLTDEERNYVQFAISACETEVLRREALEKAEKAAGYVYLMRSTGGEYKIGCSVSPERRLSSLKTGIPFDIELVYMFKVMNMRATEKLLHFRYAEKRIRGEWFALSDNDVEEIKGFSDGQIETYDAVALLSNALKLVG